jgi:hypothetical protein
MYGRIYFANANASGNGQNTSNTTQPPPNPAASEAFENMPPKERRHYIDSVLRVKVCMEYKFLKIVTENKPTGIFRTVLTLILYFPWHCHLLHSK